MSDYLVCGGLFLIFLALVAVLCYLGIVGKAKVAIQYPPPGQLVDIGGHRLHIHCQGEGSPTVVTECGHGTFSLAWTLVQEEVARFTRVCSYDRAGLGWSEPSPNARTASNIVEELHALLAQAGIKPPYVLVGHSIGGLFVRVYAHRYPDQVAGLVLDDPTHEEVFLRAPQQLVKLHRRTYAMMSALMRSAQTANSVGLAAVAPTLFIPSQFMPPLPNEELRDMYRSVVTSAARHFRTVADETDLMEANLEEVQAAQITTHGDIPLIVLLAGKASADAPGVSPEEAGQLLAARDEMLSELAAMSSNGRKVTVALSGHHIELEQPQFVIDAIRQVVKAVRARDSFDSDTREEGPPT